MDRWGGVGLISGKFMEFFRKLNRKYGYCRRLNRKTADLGCFGVMSGRFCPVTKPLKWFKLEANPIFHPGKPQRTILVPCVTQVPSNSPAKGLDRGEHPQKMGGGGGVQLKLRASSTLGQRCQLPTWGKVSMDNLGRFRPKLCVGGLNSNSEVST